MGEVAAVIVGLDHGLGKTESLLRQGDLQEASRVGIMFSCLGYPLMCYTGVVYWPSTLCPLGRFCKSIHIVPDDEAFQPDGPKGA